MKKFLSLILSIILLFSLCACGNNNKAEKYCSSCGEGISKDSAFCDHCGATIDNTKNENADISSPTNSNTENKTEKKSVFVTKSFYAVTGAVIYEQTYDEYGYPNCCYFHKKCDSCGYVSNNNGSARSNLTAGSYTCIKCKAITPVEIEADTDWVEVYE